MIFVLMFMSFNVNNGVNRPKLAAGAGAVNKDAAELLKFMVEMPGAEHSRSGSASRRVASVMRQQGSRLGAGQPIQE
jgi:hypothetical protein